VLRKLTDSRGVCVKETAGAPHNTNSVTESARRRPPRFEDSAPPAPSWLLLAFDRAPVPDRSPSTQPVGSPTGPVQQPSYNPRLRYVIISGVGSKCPTRVNQLISPIGRAAPDGPMPPTIRFCRQCVTDGDGFGTRNTGRADERYFAQ
jgi:hypothetical protein